MTKQFAAVERGNQAQSSVANVSAYQNDINAEIFANIDALEESVHAAVKA